MASYLLLETGDKIYFEDLSGYYILEAGFIVPRRIAYAKEEDRLINVKEEDRLIDVVGGE